MRSWLKLQYLKIKQDSLIFKPNHHDILPMGEPVSHGLEDVDDVYISTADGQNLHLWCYNKHKNAKTFIFFHGNTGSWVDVGMPKKGEDYDRHYRLELLRQAKDQGANFIAASMHGYGRSSGIPSEENFEHDLAAIYSYLQDQKIDADNVIILGESLGGAIAIMLGELMTNKAVPPAEIVTIATFSSMVNRVIDDHPELDRYKLASSLNHQFDSLEHLKKLSPKTKLIIFHGDNDRTTLSHHSDELFQMAQKLGLDVKQQKLEGAGHIDWNAQEIISSRLCCD